MIPATDSFRFLDNRIKTFLKNDKQFLVVVAFNHNFIVYRHHAIIKLAINMNDNFFIEALFLEVVSNYINTIAIPIPSP
jgi:hypothetical protein